MIILCLNITATKSRSFSLPANSLLIARSAGLRQRPMIPRVFSLWTGTNRNCQLAANCAVSGPTPRA